MHEAASRVWTFHRAGARRYVTFAEHLRRQPNVLTRLLLMAAAVIIAVPLAILAIFVTAVLLVFVAVFLLIHAVRGWLSRLWPSRDGRSNVRVIRRVE